MGWRRVASGTRRPSRGRIPGVATGRGCLVGNPGAAGGGPRRPARASWRASARLSGDLTIPRGCLSAPAFGDFLPGRRFGFPLRPIAGALRSHLEPLKAGNGSPPLLALHRYRATQASWTFGHPSRHSRRRSLPREGRMRIHVPSLADDAGIMRPAQVGGDKYPGEVLMSW
jgi:hypothetical protein